MTGHSLERQTLDGLPCDCGSLADPRDAEIARLREELAYADETVRLTQQAMDGWREKYEALKQQCEAGGRKDVSTG